MFIYEKNGKKRKACEVQCLCCESKFLAAEKEVKRGKAKYCSLECKNNARKNRVQLVCAQCDKEFERTPSKMAYSKSGLNFCSRECKDKAQRIGGIQAIMPSHYGTAESRARKVYRRLYKESHEIDELSCERCGYCEFECGIDIHHLDEDYTNNSKENMKALCAPCHRALHLGLWVV